jgi:hypothetical protein
VEFVDVEQHMVAATNCFPVGVMEVAVEVVLGLDFFEHLLEDMAFGSEILEELGIFLGPVVDDLVVSLGEALKRRGVGGKNVGFLEEVGLD